MKTVSPEEEKQIAHRKTFAIISHPDAGKTTVTEKLLLFGNAIHMAGEVKARKAKRFATSDWMEIEKQRGISVSSSVMKFSYKGFHLNLLDTPGHEDFSEDTYRVLTAVDSALMVIDSAKGIETQTKKLFQVCRDRQIPIMTLINKMDREGRDPFELMDEVEKELGLPCYAATWPVGQGKQFQGVYDRQKKRIRLFQAGQKVRDENIVFVDDINSEEAKKHILESNLEKLKEDLNLLEAGEAFNSQSYLNGELTPVFFASAVNNFGIQEFLDRFLEYAPQPAPRPAQTRMIQPNEAPFSGVVFKIQANMDPKHRDRVAFVRICSGVFEPNKPLFHVRKNKSFKINNAVQFFSKERQNIEKAYAGDIIGIYDKGNLIIGDTISEGEEIQFTGIPLFSPELFSHVDLKNPIKIKQLNKGLEQLAEEGTSQIFHRKHNSDLILGVVGRLQFEVVKFRLLHEYGAEALFQPLPYTLSRWFKAANQKAFDEFVSYYHSQVVYDVRGYPMILLKSEWEKDYILKEKPDISLYSSLIQYESGQQE